MGLNKAQLIDVVAKETSLKKTEVEACLKGIINAITNELADGGDVTLIGFGTFKTSTRNARTGYIPRTREQIEIPAKTVAKFKPGKNLAEIVNGEGKPVAKKPVAKKPVAKKTSKKK